MSRRWGFLFALALVLSSGLIVLNRPVAAQSAGCSAVSGLSGEFDNTQSKNMIGDFVAGETISVSAIGIDTGLPQPITLNVGGSIANPFTIPAAGSYPVTVSTDSLPEVVNATVSCSAAGGGGGSNGSPSWGGYGDGRLNPDPAEYYSLWCSGNALNIYSVASGHGVLLAAIPLGEVQALAGGGAMTASDSAGAVMTLRRLGQDAFILEGSNGNQAPQGGSKAFSLSQCLAHNGGPVATATQTLVPRPPATITPSVTPSLTATNTATASATASATITPSWTPSLTATRTATASATPTNSRTPRPTRTPTVTRTASPTKVPSDTPSATPTPDGPVRTIRPTATLPRDPVRPSATPTAAPTVAGTPFALYLGNLLISPNDSDGDGVRDGYDFCKYEPGPANGCPDPDGDGVGGPLDLCPGSVGTPGTFGCGDPDGDGLHDGVDLCPNAVGTAKAYGCPDNDDDGIPNAIDWCPLQTVVAGTAQFQGCNDPDGDSFVNGARVPVAFRDDCPAANGANYPNGCPPASLAVQMIDSLATLTAYSSEQEGQFTTIILDGVATPPPTCNMNSWGFCFGE